MTSATTSTDFVKGIILETMKAFDEAKLHWVRVFWAILIETLKAHWIGIIIVLISLFIISILFAVMGRWGMFGSLLYNYLYERDTNYY